MLVVVKLFLIVIYKLVMSLLSIMEVVSLILEFILVMVIWFMPLVKDLGQWVNILISVLK